MKIYEIGTGYTSIPARMGAATEIVVEELSNSLIRLGYDVAVIDIAADDRLNTDLPIVEVNVPKKFRSTDVQLGVMHKAKRVIYSIALSNKLKGILKHTNRKIILHFHNQYNLFFFSKIIPKSLRKRCYILYTNHSYVWHGEWNNIKDDVKKRYFQEISCMKYADKIFVLNDIAKKNICEHIGIPNSKLVLIDNGVNTRVYRPLANIESIKKKYQLEGKKVFIQVGSVCDRKNQLGSLRLLSHIMEINPNIAFAYAGGIIDTNYKDNIDKYVKEHGIEDRVKYVGELTPGEQLNEFYNLGETMIFPSKAEGFSLVILEAMSAGLPVIISKNLKFKLANYCLRFDDEESFENILENNIFNSDKHIQMKTLSRESVIENYSWDKIAQDYMNTIKGTRK